MSNEDGTLRHVPRTEATLFDAAPTAASLYLPPVDASAGELDFVERLAATPIGETFNQFSGNAGRLQREMLLRYLSARRSAEIVLCGGAAGYRGARLSGVAFTSVAQLGLGNTSEASATIVHRTLAELGLEDDVLLWNVVPTHPHPPDNAESNRPPTPAEIRTGSAFLRELQAERIMIAVGKVAAAALPGAPSIRHPARGGAREFASGLRHLALQLEHQPGVLPSGTRPERRPRT